MRDSSVTALGACALTACALAACALGAAPSAHAQSGVGTLSGAVLPRASWHGGGFGDWAAPLRRLLGEAVTTAAASVTVDTLVVGRLVLTRLTEDNEVMVCLPGPAVCRRPVPLVALARGLYGHYAFPQVPMGEYRMRVEAEGCGPVERNVVVLSDSRSVEHVALTCTPGG